MINHREKGERKEKENIEKKEGATESSAIFARASQCDTPNKIIANS